MGQGKLQSINGRALVATLVALTLVIAGAIQAAPALALTAWTITSPTTTYFTGAVVNTTLTPTISPAAAAGSASCGVYATSDASFTTRLTLSASLAAGTYKTHCTAVANSGYAVSPTETTGTLTVTAKTAFTCDASFYQMASGKGYKLSASSGFAYSEFGVNTTVPGSINAIGWNPDDNFIYGILGSALYIISNNPSGYVATSAKTLASSPASTGGDFYRINGKSYLLSTGSSTTVGTAWNATDVATGTVTSITPTGTSGWGAFDITFIGNKGYGINGTTLYIATLSDSGTLGSLAVSIATKTITNGTGKTIGSTENFGAAYADGDGNAYFFSNTNKHLFGISKANLTTASPALAWYVTPTGPVAPNDGASCPVAASPTAPVVTTGSASSVTTTTASVAGTVTTPNLSGAAVTSLAPKFCYALTSSALPSSPIDCTNSSTTTVAQNASNVSIPAALSGLTPGTTYYYQAQATSDGGATGYGSIQSFTTLANWSIAANSATYSVGGTVPTLTGQASPTAGLSGSLTCRAYTSADSTYSTPLTINSSLAVGDYVVHCTGTAASGYAASPSSNTNGTLQVTSLLAWSITGQNATYQLAGSAPSLTGVAGAGLSGSLTCRAYAKSDSTYATPLTLNTSLAVGTYWVHCTGASASGYADPAITNGELTVSLSPWTITASNAAYTIGTTAPTLTGTASPSGGLSGSLTCRAYRQDDTTYTTPLTLNSGLAEGTYAVHCTGTAASNYTTLPGTNTDGQLVVSSLTSWTITASDASYEHGGSVPTLTGSATAGALSGSLACSAYASSDSGFSSPVTINSSLAVGSYVVRCTGNPNSGYSLTPIINTAVLTVTAKAWTITASAASYTQGGVVPTLSGTATAGALSGSLTCRAYQTTDLSFGSPLTIDATLSAGTYTIRCMGSPASTYSANPTNVTATLTVSAVVASTYSVTYNGNSSSGGSVPSDSNSYSAGDQVTVLDNTGSLVRGTYTFNGWNTASGGGGTARAAGDQFNIGSADVTLWAQWVGVVTYNANDGSGSPSTSTQNYAPSATTALNRTLPAGWGRTGYTFLGWSTSSTATSADPSHTVTGSATLYAVWQINTHTVSFSNGSGATTTASITGVQYGADLDAIINAKDHPSRTGYTFSAWQISSADITSSETMPDSDVTVTVRWTVNTHTVSFSTGSGCSTVASFSLAYASNLQAQVSSRSTPSCVGYTFSKWQVSNADITSGQTMPDNDVTVTAVWTTNTHTVSFSNGSGATTTASVTGVAYASDLDGVINAKTHPTRSGYTFGAWQLLGSDITTSETMPDNDVTVTVRWVANTHTVTFDSNGGTSLDPVTGVEYNSDLDALVASQTHPTRTGYTFSKWQISNADITSGQTMPDNDVTVKAVWTVNRHTVSFNNGAGASTTASVTNVSYGSDLDAIINAKAHPTLTGYTWAAWQISSVDITSSETMPDSDVTVTVRWSINTYTVSFSNGSGASTTPAVTDVEYNSDLDALVASQTHPTRTGYTFSKWQISGLDITSGQTMPASNVTVSAVWTTNSHTLLFDTGSDGSTIDPLSVSYGANLRTQLNAVTNPTRTGYTFSKWQIGGADVLSSQTMPDNDVTAVAVWTINSHTVSFSTGLNASTVASRSLAYGGNLEALISSIAAPSRPGYQFDKWQIAGSDIASGLTMPDEDVTVTAVWLTVYTLTYHANGGTGAPSAVTTTTNFAAAVAGAMRLADHAFVKWNTQEDGLGDDYLALASVPNSVTDLYAVWVLSGNEVQAITYVQPTTQALSDGSLTVAPVTDANGLTVDLASDTPLVCSVSGFVITYITSGLCTTTASQPGDAQYQAATPVTRSFRIIEITTEQLEGGRVGATYTSPQTLSGAAGGGLWSTASSLPAGLSVNQLTGALEGQPSEIFSGNVTFSYTEDGATVTRTLLLEIVETTVGAQQAITFAQPRTKTLILGHFSISPVTDASGLTVVVESQTTSTCTVVGFTVTFHKVGLCTLAATQPGNGTYQAATPVVRSFRIIKLLTPSLPQGHTGSPYRATQTLGGARGNGSYSTVSTLPAGLALTPSTGVLSGIPTELYDRTITITYTEDGASTSVRLRLSIFAGTSLTPVTGTDPTPTPSPSPEPTPGTPVANSVDIGHGVTPVKVVPKLDTISQTDIDNLQAIGDKAMEGFKPSAGASLDIVGAKTLGVFTVVPGAPVDVSALAKALPNTGQGQSFIKSATITDGSAPTEKALENLGVVDGDEFFFKTAGLGKPTTLADANVAGASQWVRVTVSLTGFRPGTTAYLVATSDPIIFGQVVVNQYGVATVSGSMAMDLLPAGVHRIRVVGNRDLGTTSTDAAGKIVLSEDQLAEIRQFDEGTFATVRIEGTNAAGGQGLSIRVIPIEKNVPWWLLWVFGALVLASFALRWRRIAEGRLGRVLKRAGIGLIGVLLLLAGLIIEVPAFAIVAVAIAAVGLVGSWLPRRRARRQA